MHYKKFCAILLGFEDIECVCGIGYNSTLTPYYPDYESENISDYTDIKGKKLRTLQVLFKNLICLFVISYNQGWIQGGMGEIPPPQFVTSVDIFVIL